MTASARPTARPLLVAVAALVVAAAVMWGASAVTWPKGAPTWLTGVALLALAGIAGVVATGGVARRLVGGLLALAGIAAVIGAAAEVGGGGFAPWLAIVGAAVLAGGGAFVVAREPRMAGFGSRYARTGATPKDPDRAAWQDLDEGRDPTV